ncbi:phosphoribosyltransferase family protein [Micromonospora sp. NPDC003197]
MPDELRKLLVEHFRWVDPGPAASHLVSDVSGWWRDPTILARLGPALADLFRADQPTVVVSPEVTGLMLGPLVATALGVGLVPAYKERPDSRLIAEPTTWATTTADYRGRTLTLGVRDRHLRPGDRVLLVDDWVATGAQLRALYQVITARSAEPIGTAAVIADCPTGLAAELRVRALLTGADL